jgi:hypothetical protein
MDSEQARQIAQRIAKGLAYSKLVARGDDFPEIKSRDEFADLIYQVLTDPFSVAKQLRAERQAFWSERHRAIVILDRLSEDGGTAYRPVLGKEHFRFLR